MPVMRLDKFLSNMGVESRKGVRSFLREGAVSVDGEIVKKQDMKIDTDKNIIKVYDEVLVYQKYIYLMMNKPPGVISATDDPSERDQTVIDLIPEEFAYFDPFPVGRLDKDTEGLLLLSNDGIFSHRTLSPKKHVPKVYYAKISGKLTDLDIAAFEKGIKLDDGYVCQSAGLKILSSGEISEGEITISEGKFHQVKRMFEAVGKSVTYLKRLSFAGIMLDESLELGDVRELNVEEMQKISRFISNEN